VVKTKSQSQNRSRIKDADGFDGAEEGKPTRQQFYRVQTIYYKQVVAKRLPIL
jgi:hypothetical protein